ncbi:hypothetical protein KKF82_04260 [Patescibacteria group bacterium]|nr:hypothetical protein [Patescibacteria group bacterium]
MTDIPAGREIKLEKPYVTVFCDFVATAQEMDIMKWLAVALGERGEFYNCKYDVTICRAALAAKEGE